MPFPKMKKEFSGSHFTTHDVIAAVNNFLEAQDADFYKDRICMLNDHRTKYANVEGNLCWKFTA